MTRGELRAFVIGALLAVSMCIGALMVHDGQLSAAIVQQDRTSDSLTTLLLASERRSRASEARQAEANQAAEHASARAESLANRLDRVVTRIAVRPATTPSVSGDTVRYAFVLRPNDTTSYRVPSFLVEDRDALLTVVMQFKGAWESERTARLQYANETVPDLHRQLEDADRVIGSLRQAIVLRDSRSKPRCGRKCGMAIGAVLTIASAVGIEKVRGAIQ